MPDTWIEAMAAERYGNAIRAKKSDGFKIGRDETYLNKIMKLWIS